MSAVSPEALVADVTGPAAPPRRNGELVFEEPWESRAFGIAVALCERRAYAWEDFRRGLIDEIGAWEREYSGDPERRWCYYERWLASLERLLLERGLVTERELAARVDELRESAEHEHDHND